MAMTATRNTGPSPNAGASSSRFARAVSTLLSPFSNPHSSSRSASRPSSLAVPNDTTATERPRRVSEATLAKAGSRSRTSWHAFRSVVSLNHLNEPGEERRAAEAQAERQRLTSSMNEDLALALAGPSGQPGQPRHSSFGSASASTSSGSALDMRPVAPGTDSPSSSSRSLPAALRTRLTRTRSTTSLAVSTVAHHASRSTPGAPPRIALADFGFERDGPPTPPPLPAADVPRIELHLVDTALEGLDFDNSKDDKDHER